MRKNTAVFGIFNSQQDAHQAAIRLREGGFRPTDITVIVPENEGNKDLGHEIRTKAPEGTSFGGVIGALLGGLAGWMAASGMITGLTMPGITEMMNAGPILSCLAGIGAGSLLGGVTGGLVGLTMPEIEAKRYLGRVRRGSILVSVHCDNGDYEKRAKLLMKHAGAQQMTAATEARADFDNSDRPHARHAVHQM
jgi:hypothetical protein